MDVAGWLRSLHLSQYEAAICDSEIDADVLPELTEQHLKDLGVSLGHRLKMLRSIRELAEHTMVKAQPALLPEAKPHAQAERRQLTVIFCDLVGSTGKPPVPASSRDHVTPLAARRAGQRLGLRSGGLEHSDLDCVLRRSQRCRFRWVRGRGQVEPLASESPRRNPWPLRSCAPRRRWAPIEIVGQRTSPS